MRALILWAGIFCGCSENKLSTLGEPDAGDGPMIEVTPMSLQFGYSAYEAEPISQTFVITSVGGSDLEVTNLRLGGEAAGSYTILSEETNFMLAPGASREVEVVFEPVAANEQTAQALVDSNDPLAATVPVELYGEGLMSELMITPDPLDFGATYVGCFKDNVVTLTNVGSEPLEISEIDLEADGFVITEQPELPLVLGVGENTTLDLTFTPDVEASYTGNITVASTEPIGVRDSEIYGTGSYFSEHQDAWDFPVQPSSDIIFSVDQSGSMDDNNALLGANFSTFITQLNNYTSDWQVLVANADDGCTNSGIITGATNPSVFGEAVMSDEGIEMECCGYYGELVPMGDTERLLTISSRAVENTDSGECNAGFMRDDAMLHIILVSDEPEQSFPGGSLPTTDCMGQSYAGYETWIGDGYCDDGSWGYYFNCDDFNCDNGDCTGCNYDPAWATLVDAIIAKKGDPDMVRISAIAGDVPDGCSGNGTSAYPGAGYAEAVEYTDGVFLSICSDWASAENLELLAEASVTQSEYVLTYFPVEETIVVNVNGEPITDGSWYYDLSSNAVIFTINPPASGDSIVIDYATWAECD